MRSSRVVPGRQPGPPVRAGALLPGGSSTDAPAGFGIAFTRRSSAGRRLVTAPIRAYSRFVSPALPARCRYRPTCSAYAVQAIQSYGILRGLVLAAWRVLRCNPWSHGGVDPVHAQRLFRPPKRPTS